MTQQPLIAARELHAALDEPDLVILDCRADLADPDWGRREYLAGHLPGALFASLNDHLSGPITASSGRHPLPDPAQFARTLAAWGVGPRSRVVTCDQGPGAYAARLWWMLRARGHERVQVLDGGLAAWRAAGLPLESGQREVLAQRVSGAGFSGLVTTEDVVGALHGGSALLVDARPADRFAGRNETIDPVAGHIPGAVNHPFAGNLGVDGLFLPAAQLRQRWLETLAGRDPAQLISTCGSGITACHNLLALAVAGLPGGKLYAGSFSEWIRDPLRPVAT